MTPHEAKGATQYTTYHPRWYRTRVSTYWWLGKWYYLKFVLRELSSIFVAYFVVITLLQIHSLSRGPEAYARFEERMRNPRWTPSPFSLCCSTRSHGSISRRGRWSCA